jgi:hypothetical protein
MEPYIPLVWSKHRRYSRDSDRFLDYDECDPDTYGGPVSLGTRELKDVWERVLGEVVADWAREDSPLFHGRYSAYLRSPHWLLMRTRARRRAGYRCQRCESDASRLEVHHLTYARLGWERDSDLIVLCEPCHEQEHGL